MRRRIAPFIFIALIAAATVPAVARPHFAASHSFADKFAQSAQSTSAKPVQHVIVISIDGMKPESYTEPDAHGLKIPTLRQIVRDGASSDGVQPVMPTVTYPSHTTMVTGVNPGTHGIVTNPAWDPFGQNYNGYRWYEEDIRVPTLWQLARQHGLHTALIHWPVTVGAQADIIVPEIWRANIPGGSEASARTFHARHSRRGLQGISRFQRGHHPASANRRRLHRRRLLRDQKITAEPAPPPPRNGRP